jgi:chromosome segregation ATPase
MKLATVIALLILVCYSKAFLSSFMIPQVHWDAPESQLYHRKYLETCEIKLQKAHDTIEVFKILINQKDAELNESLRINIQNKRQIVSLYHENSEYKRIAYHRYIQIVDYRFSVDNLFQNVTNRHESLIHQKDAEIFQRDETINRMTLEFNKFQVQKDAEINKMKLEFEKFQADAAQLKKELDQKDSTIKELEARILDSNDEIVTLNDQLEEKDSQISYMDQEITKKNTTISEKDHHLSRKDNYIRTLKTENSEFRVLVKKIHGDLIKQESEIKSNRIILKEFDMYDSNIKEFERLKQYKLDTMHSIDELKKDVTYLSGKIKETNFLKKHFTSKKQNSKKMKEDGKDNKLKETKNASKSLRNILRI